MKNISSPSLNREIETTIYVCVERERRLTPWGRTGYAEGDVRELILHRVRQQLFGLEYLCRHLSLSLSRQRRKRRRNPARESSAWSLGDSRKKQRRGLHSSACNPKSIFSLPPPLSLLQFVVEERHGNFWVVVSTAKKGSAEEEINLQNTDQDERVTS